MKSKSVLFFLKSPFVWLLLILATNHDYATAQDCTTPIDQSSFMANADDDGVTRYFDADIFLWPNGDLIGGHGYWFGTSDFCESELVSRVSTNNGATDWPGPGATIFNYSHPAFIPTSPGQVTYGVHSPSFLISADKTKMHMFFLVKSKGTDCLNFECEVELGQSCFNFENRIFQSEIELSGDYDPQNWSSPVEISEAITGYNIMNNARAIRLSNGIIALAVTVSEEINTSPTNFRSYLLYSADEGQTWSRTAEVSISDDLASTGSMRRGFLEPDIVEIIENGIQKVMMVMRVNNPQVRYNTIPIYNLSGDWELPPLSTFPPSGDFPDVAHNSPVSIERINCNDDLLIIFNEKTNEPTGTSNGDRNRLVSMVSSDEGQTWSQFNVIESNSNPISAYSYVSITQQNNKILLSYYRRNITGNYSTFYRRKSISSFYDTDNPLVYDCYYDENCIDLTACQEEEDYGFIFLQHEDESEINYQWSFPLGSSAIEINNGKGVVNASEGLYTVTMTNSNGFHEIRTFDILADCCNSCAPPRNLDCNYDEGSVTLEWDHVQEDVEYILQIYPNSSACCSGVESPVPLPIYPEGNSYSFPLEDFTCFSWQVSTICKDGVSESEPSTLMCFVHGECFPAGGHHHNLENQINKR